MSNLIIQATTDKRVGVEYEFYVNADGGWW